MEDFMPNNERYNTLNQRINTAKALDFQDAIDEFVNIRTEIDENSDDLGENFVNHLNAGIFNEVMLKRESRWAELYKNTNKDDLNEMQEVESGIEQLSIDYPDQQRFQIGLVQIRDKIIRLRQN